MRKLLYIVLSILVASCVGGTVTPPSEVAMADSDSVPTIVTIVDTATTEDTTLMSLTPQQVDSMVFRLTHHYSENFNFLVKADSLTLIPREGDLLTDTCVVHKGNVVAVAAIKVVPGDSIDSIWVKVASNQMTMGWLRERELLKGTTPDDTISELLDALSSSRAIWMSAFVVIGVLALLLSRGKNMGKQQLLHFFDEMTSIYPPLFLLLVAMMASLYASVQNFVPEFWQEYYFHPTLNPLVLPPLMAALVVVLWLVVITYLAVIEEVYHHFYFLPGITYLAKLSGAAMLVYLIISWTTLLYVGYFLLVALFYCMVRVIVQHVKKLS
ncbi:MAG: zinc ribbon domain-containing protein [Bacteroidaceae bacterium]|nr:zinc ribbon domain-containing protein [Bacteroidaceae bacterium]